MKCKKCSFDNIAEARFCENCGLALPQQSTGRTTSSSLPESSSQLSGRHVVGREKVVETIKQRIQQNLLDPNEEFVTFTVSDNEDSWVQFAHMSVNAASPHEEQPDLSFGENLLDEYVPEVIDWQANAHITYQFEKTSADHIARWIDAYFVAVLGASASGYRLDVKSSSDEVASIHKGSDTNPLGGLLFGQKDTRTFGSQIGREIVRGVLGSILGGKRK